MQSIDLKSSTRSLTRSLTKILSSKADLDIKSSIKTYLSKFSKKTGVSEIVESNLDDEVEIGSKEIE